MKLVTLYGYRPELHCCLRCKAHVEQGKYRWHALRGGVVCTSCVQSDEEQFFSARALSDDSLKLIRFALTESFQDQLKPHLKGSALMGFHEALESLIISHFPTIPAVSVRGACALM
jgi:recombinational DNA repair protein (RecF pathway)